MFLSRILFRRLIFLITILIGGCVNSNDVGRKEIEIKRNIFIPAQYVEHSKNGSETLFTRVRSAEPETLILWTNYAGKLSIAFTQMSDASAAAQRATALGIIGAAVTASGAIAYDGNLDLLKGAGLAGGTLAALTAYFNPAKNAKSLLTAAEKLHCIEYAGATADESLETDSAAILLMKSNIRRVTLSLRLELERDPPSYEQIVRDITAAQNINITTKRGFISAFYKGNNKHDIEELQKELDKCFI